MNRQQRFLLSASLSLATTILTVVGMEYAKDSQNDVVSDNAELFGMVTVGLIGAKTFKNFLEIVDETENNRVQPIFDFNEPFAEIAPRAPFPF